ncbi:predicted protein [Candida tropicalis MYA-3404]|uniref:Uncharacterized protein n=1 Tax=Candida tropicalis (strain ATCC MYA-3404 / T1) TaxID=294747 RepID=C5M7I6_CANTT|nr:predicted protein [Candida tropicalis MYA-3404]EER34956.1 predicted protein [Candida tropicalis MYA-3404]KAG4408840.1 hypothetical protein JTP64_002146 [Candida tropicalis]
MPDLFDNFFNKIGSRINGGKSVHHYGGASQVNTGKFYSYTSSASNNNYWLPKQQHKDDQMTSGDIRVDRQMSVSSMSEEADMKNVGDRSRMSSVSE